MMERPDKLPNGWIWAQLQDIIKPKVTIDPKKRGEGAFKYIDIDALDSKRKIIINPKEIKNQEAPSRARRLINYGDVLISLVRPYLMNIAIVPKELNNQIASTAFYVLKPENDIDSRFLYYAINRKSFIDSIVTYGNSPPSARDYEFIQLTIPLAPFKEQSRIVAKLETLLTQVKISKRNLGKVLPLITQFHQSALAAACSGRLTENWRKAHRDVGHASEIVKLIRKERIQRYEEECCKAKAEGRRKPKNPKNLKLQKLEAKELPELPEEWVWTNLYNLSYLITKGATPTSYGFGYIDKGVNFVKVENISKNIIDSNTLHHITAEAHEFLRRSQLQENDILFSIAGTIGRSAIVGKHHLPANTNQALAIIRLPCHLISIEYVQFSLANYTTILSAHNEMRGAGMNNISLGDVKNIIIPIPPLSEQFEIVKNIKNLFHITDKIEKCIRKANEQTKCLSQSILTKAFRGELVPQDPNDEPASILLERIRKEKPKLKKKKTLESNSKTLLDFMESVTEY